jgi:hypothetical protein
MESMPGQSNSPETKPFSKTIDGEACRQIGARALHPTYEDYEDAHSALGGGVRPYRMPEVPKVYPTGLTETVLFADQHQRELIDPRHGEVVRTYELSLDVLSSAQFHELSLKDQMRVAVAGHYVIESAEHRSDVLKIDGNFENPMFLHYGFTTQEEASEYAEELKLLHHELMTRDVVIDIELAYRALKSKSRASTLAELKKQTRDLTVSVSDNGKVVVGNKAIAK